MNHNRKVGHEGEEQAVIRLQNAGLLILARNFRVRQGEIDIIALDGDTTVFVEVKARKDASFGRGAEAVDMRRQKRLVQAALVFLQQQGKMDDSCRFDVIEVVQGEVNWIINAFDATGIEID